MLAARPGTNDCPNSNAVPYAARPIRRTKCVPLRGWATTPMTHRMAYAAACSNLSHMPVTGSASRGNNETTPIAITAHQKTTFFKAIAGSDTGHAMSRVDGPEHPDAVSLGEVDRDPEHGSLGFRDPRPRRPDEDL